MEQPEIGETPEAMSRPGAHESAAVGSLSPPAPMSPGGRAPAIISPQGSAGSCPTCGSGVNGTGPASLVYAIGRIEPRFPTPSVERSLRRLPGATRRAA